MSDPVLLFYDGHERRAEDAFLARVKSDIRRHLRVRVNKLRGKQVMSGYYTWFNMLLEALQRGGCEVRINDFRTAKARPDYPIGVAGYESVLDKVASLPNPRLLGPGLYASPLEGPNLFDDPRNRLYITTCDWYADMMAAFYGRERLRHWFGGFDVSRFEDTRNFPKTHDVLIYDKIYFNRDEIYTATIKPFIAELDKRGLSYQLIRYGSYIYEDYIDALKKCRSMAFFVNSETQGMACQECMALNVPVFAFDPGIWDNPASFVLNPTGVPCTSVPYFDDRCGVTFQEDTMLLQWSTFWENVYAYRPRDFLDQTLTFEGSATAYMKSYTELMRV